MALPLRLVPRTNSLSTVAKSRVSPTSATQIRLKHTTSGPKQRSYTQTRKSTTAASGSVEVELNYLRNIVLSHPFLFDTSKLPTFRNDAKAPEEKHFAFPLGTLFTAPTREIGLNMHETYAHALREHGIVGIDLGFEDPSSQFLLDLVDAMNCHPDTHSSTQGALWDVKYNPKGVYSDALGKSAHSISHSLGEFAWHTDGAFEQNPTRYFGFHILHPDKEGGGIFRLLRAEQLANILSPQAVETLTTHEFNLRVPPEFYKGQSTVTGKLLEFDEDGERAYVRYRRDILFDPPSSDPKACAAVEELNTLLEQPESVGESMPAEVFKENTILLMDNARFLHSRTDIKDPKRWLRRVRFHGTPGTKESA